MIENTLKMLKKVKDFKDVKAFKIVLFQVQKKFGSKRIWIQKIVSPKSPRKFGSEKIRV